MRTTVRFISFIDGDEFSFAAIFLLFSLIFFIYSFAIAFELQYCQSFISFRYSQDRHPLIKCVSFTLFRFRWNMMCRIGEIRGMTVTWTSKYVYTLTTDHCDASRTVSVYTIIFRFSFGKCLYSRMSTCVCSSVYSESCYMFSAFNCYCNWLARPLILNVTWRSWSIISPKYKENPQNTMAPTGWTDHQKEILRQAVGKNHRIGFFQFIQNSQLRVQSNFSQLLYILYTILQIRHLWCLRQHWMEHMIKKTETNFNWKNYI